MAEGGSYPLVVVVHLEKHKTITTVHVCAGHLTSLYKTITTVHVCAGHLTSLSKARHKWFNTTLVYNPRMNLSVFEAVGHVAGKTLM